MDCFRDSSPDTKNPSHQTNVFFRYHKVTSRGYQQRVLTDFNRFFEELTPVYMWKKLLTDIENNDTLYKTFANYSFYHI